MPIGHDSEEYSAIKHHYKLWLEGLEKMDNFYKNDYSATEEGRAAFAQFREDGYEELERRDIAYAEYREKFGDPKPEEFLQLQPYEAQMFWNAGVIYLHPKISKYLDSLGLGQVYSSVDRMKFYVDGFFRSNPQGIKTLKKYENWSIVHNISEFFDDDDD